MTVFLIDVYLGAAPAVRGYVARLARMADRHNPDDVMGEILALLTAQTMDPASAMSPVRQVFRTAEVAIRRHKRQSARRASVLLQTTDTTPEPVQRRTPETLLGMRAVLASLTPRERRIVTLAAQGLTGREIAAVVGLTPARVSQLRSNIRARI